MNRSSRVPGVSRNSEWQTIEAEIAARRELQRRTETEHVKAQEGRRVQ